MKKQFIVAAFVVLTSAAQSQNSELGKAATETTVEVIINAPIERVWAEFANIGGIFKNSPTVANSFCSSEIKEGIGATRHMEMSKMIKKGATLDERVIEWKEGSYQKLEAYEMYKVSGIKTMGGDFELIEKGDKTILRSTLNYSMNSRLWGMMNRMVGKKKFVKIWKSIIAGYKFHIETGEEVTDKTNLNTKEVKLIEIVIS